jgi:hypothetical protein
VRYWTCVRNALVNKPDLKGNQSRAKKPTEEQGRTGDDFVVLRDDEGAVRCSDAKVDMLRLQEVGAVALQLEFLASALPAAARWRDGREVAVALGDPVPGANA